MTSPASLTLLRHAPPPPPGTDLSELMCNGGFASVASYSPNGNGPAQLPPSPRPPTKEELEAYRQQRKANKSTEKIFFNWESPIDWQQWKAL